MLPPDPPQGIFAKMKGQAMDFEAENRMAQVLHHRKAGLSLGDPVVPPISLTTIFHLPEAQGAAYYYGRSGQPTWDAVETQLAMLEAAEVVTFPSGMAAISAALLACEAARTTARLSSRRTSSQEPI